MSVNSIKLSAHSLGLVFVEISNKTVKRIVGKSVAQVTALKNAAPLKEKPSWEAAVKIRQILNDMNNPGANGWCKPTLTNAFKRSALLMNDDSWRTDTIMTLAFQTVNDVMQYVGICSYGQADPDDRTFNDNILEGRVVGGRVLEIDLLCTKNASRGTGTMLLAYCIAKQFARKARGRVFFKYTDVVIPLASHHGIYPLQNPALRLGFEDEACGPRRDPPYNQERIVSLRREDFVIPDIRDLEKLCALKPRSGLQYCS